MSQFVSSTDRQLWITKNKPFVQPLWCVGGEVGGNKYWLVSLTYTQSIPKKIREEVSGDLYHRSINKDPFSLVISDEDLRDYAEPVYGTNPTYWARYTPEPQERKPIATTSVTTRPQEADSSENLSKHVSDERFLKMAWKMSPIADFKVFKMVWIALCQAMPHRLIIDMIPIDFGWAKLHALPYRKNWKQIALSRIPNYLEIMRNTQGNTLFQRALQTELPMHLRNTVMIALDGEYKHQAQRTFCWTLEVEEGAEFHEWTRALEQQRNSEAGRKGYAAQWAGIINKQLTDIIRVFHSFATQTSAPAAQLGRGRSEGIGGLVPYTVGKSVRPARVDDVPVDPVTLNAGELRDDKGRRLVVGTPKNVPTMPVLRAVPAYLRESGGSDARLEWKGQPEDRMLVLGPDGRTGQTEDVLVQVAGGDDGLEGVIQAGDVTVVRTGQSV